MADVSIPPEENLGAVHCTICDSSGATRWIRQTFAGSNFSYPAARGVFPEAHSEIHCLDATNDPLPGLTTGTRRVISHSGVREICHRRALEAF